MAGGTLSIVTTRLGRGARLCVLILSFCLLLSASFAHAQVSTPTPDARVIADDILRLRAQPTTNSDILSLLQPATPLTVLGISDDRDWLHVQTSDNILGWV